MMDPSLPVVVIVGAGFGGLRAAQALRNAPVRVILVDRRNYHLFQPLLYQVATAGLAPGEIAYPVRAILRDQKNLEFRMATVTGVDLEKRCLATSTGRLEYDTLILAIGARTNYYGIHSAAEHGFGLKDLDEAVAIRNHVLRMFELAAQEQDPEIRRAMLTFVVVGGGPTGVESAGALAELTRLVQLKDFAELRPQELRVLLLEATDNLLAGMPDSLCAATAETLWQKHVEVRFGALVTDYDGRQVHLKSGEIIPARTLVWAAGARTELLADTLGVEQASLGRIVVRSTLQLPDYPRVFCIGDATYWEENGKPLPMVAPAAIQQAEIAARNVRKLLAEEPLEEFVYKNPGSLATIGRNSAVVQVGRFKFRGFIAWLVWLVIHIMRLVGFRNRLVVLINWAWDYFFYDRAVRLITPDGRWSWTRPGDQDNSC
ncbi:MAG: NAD(P)/FAD-dependent oxidoreductase [Anaerolineales bacterium]|nr:NAD(P)/FAD-dependent oxidoreductase [Anaerolineales bacterium]